MKLRFLLGCLLATMGAVSLAVPSSYFQDKETPRLQLAQVVINSFWSAGTSQTELNLEISTDADDAYDNNGSLQTGSTQLLVGQFIGAINDVGLRFSGCTIPAGATIDSATLTIEVLSVGSTGGVSIVQGHETNDAGTWASDGPATVPVTTANVTRTLGTVQTEAFDVAAIIQEIVDSQSGISNNIAFVVNDNGSANGRFSFIEARENVGTAHATLDITYTS